MSTDEHEDGEEIHNAKKTAFTLQDKHTKFLNTFLADFHAFERSSNLTKGNKKDWIAKTVSPKFIDKFGLQDDSSVQLKDVRMVVRRWYYNHSVQKKNKGQTQPSISTGAKSVTKSAMDIWAEEHREALRTRAVELTPLNDRGQLGKNLAPWQKARDEGWAALDSTEQQTYQALADKANAENKVGPPVEHICANQADATTLIGNALLKKIGHVWGGIGNAAIFAAIVYRRKEDGRMKTVSISVSAMADDMPGLVLSNAKEFRGDLLGWSEQVLPDLLKVETDDDGAPLLPEWTENTTTAEGRCLLQLWGLKCYDWLVKAAPKQEADVIISFKEGKDKPWQDFCPATMDAKDISTLYSRLRKEQEDDNDEAHTVVYRCLYPAEKQDKKDKKDKKPVKKPKNDEPADVIHDFAPRPPKRGPAPPPPPPAPTPPPPPPAPLAALSTPASPVPSVDNDDAGGGEKASRRKKNKMDAASAKPDGEKDGDGSAEAGGDGGPSKKRNKEGGRAKRDGEKGGREAGNDEGSSKKRKKHGGNGSAQAGGDEGSPKKRKKDSDGGKPDEKEDGSANAEAGGDDGSAKTRKRKDAASVKPDGAEAGGDKGSAGAPSGAKADGKRGGSGEKRKKPDTESEGAPAAKKARRQPAGVKATEAAQPRRGQSNAVVVEDRLIAGRTVKLGTTTYWYRLNSPKLPAPFKWTDKYKVSHVKESLIPKEDEGTLEF
ncbi:hypothetical protein B0H16DRAFT_1697359 [Mycena metata]|uniref:Uncharacterized protein n=1 Tax=Mycena metata TaxID=1033252 RepID=A0AAD7HUN2_9AGAR|nr:hypothetical protein B0H16DRAFT_1697359 [Mycena metata]